MIDKSEIEIYFQAIEKPEIDTQKLSSKNLIFNNISANFVDEVFPSLENINIAILGVNESRISLNNEASALAPDKIRPFFYQLFNISKHIKIADLGNLKAGDSIDDTYFALSNVLSELINNNILPIIIGGSQDLTYANYLAYQRMGKVINITSIDSKFDLGNSEENFNSESYLSKIILHQPNFLFNYTNIGYQTYFVDNEAVSLMSKLYFDVYRLGIIRSDIKLAEPLIRNSDIVSFDISAVRHSDAPANPHASPNGFFGDEACALCRYAGISDKVSSIGFYELNPELDINNQSSHLIAQMIWYFIEGYSHRKNDFPHLQKEDYLKYHTAIEEVDDGIVFYKSKKSGRWWMEVPLNSEQDEEKYKRHFMVPCSYEDYLSASKNHVPDRWWQVFKKLM
jgi:arginase family enzyme